MNIPGRCGVCKQAIKPGERYLYHCRLQFSWHESHTDDEAEAAAGEQGMSGHTLLVGRVPDVP